ncbi:MAG: DivIVA domain-containing protein [Clostridiales bacterium]|jgi:cell division septum initiation protein DivIVA|nr:DivIVA domain-containing protein [Clostridiales bacterium]
MSEFSVVKKGYDKTEVDDYIAKTNGYLEDKLKEQKLRINELKNQNLKLAKIIKELKGREDDVKNALIAANEKSKEIASAARLKYAMEGQRLRLLQAKWLNHFETEACENDDYKKSQAYYVKIEAELQEILKSDFGIQTEKTEKSQNDEIVQQFKSETKRLFGNSDDKEVYGEIIKNIKKEFGSEFSAAFDELEHEIEIDTDEDIEFTPRNNNLAGGSTDNIRVLIDGRAGGALQSGDYSNMAAIKPEQSLEELCRELGL